jgi:hypothetical protein
VGNIERARKALRDHFEKSAEAEALRLSKLPKGQQPDKGSEVRAWLSRYETVHRSEIAVLAADIVAAEREYQRFLKKLDHVDLGEGLGHLPAIADIDITYDGERKFTITAGGKARQFTVPCIIDRGVWNETRGYEIGDAVTHGGSLWIARDHLPQHEPGKGAGWRLAVVKGRNGRDAKPTYGGTR